MRRKNDVWLDDAELEQIKQVAEKRDLSVSAYLRRVGVREARDELLEQAANRRLAAQKQERELETFGYVAEPPQEPTLAPEPVEEKDPGQALTWAEYEIRYAEAMQAYKSRLDRLRHCPHKGIAPGAVCPGCNQLVKPRGSQGRVLTKPRFSFSTPHGKGGL
jgi:hypothetical protein